jgi:hypothetical protein
MPMTWGADAEEAYRTNWWSPVSKGVVRIQRIVAKQAHEACGACRTGPGLQAAWVVRMLSRPG